MEKNREAVAIAKRVWKIVRVALFMLRKGISKAKLMVQLNNMTLKRGGKAITNFMFHHHHHHGGDGGLQFSSAREYEFSCSNTPNNLFEAIVNSNKRHRHKAFFTCAHAPPTLEEDATVHMTVKGVLEMLNNAASPAPAMAMVRVTDSPFPLRESDDDNDNHVDKAAEDFIKRFYNDLKKQI